MDIRSEKGRHQLPCTAVRVIDLYLADNRIGAARTSVCG